MGHLMLSPMWCPCKGVCKPLACYHILDMLCRPSFGHTVKSDMSIFDGPEESAGPGIDWKNGERACEIQHRLGGISAADPNFDCVQPTIV